MLLEALGIVFVAGVLGGAVNALMSDNGFALPRHDDTVKPPIWRPGFLGNMLIGGFAAAVSWGLYGPAANMAVLGAAVTQQPATESDTKTAPPAAAPPLTLAALVGAALVGVGGARWLSNEVDKNLLRATAAKAALGNKNDALAARIAFASPAQALKEAAQEAPAH